MPPAHNTGVLLKHTWLKLFTSLLWSKKFRRLPDNDHRLVYVCLLILSKLDLLDEPHELLAPLCFVSAQRFSTIVHRLSEVGLLAEDGTVQGFEESQDTPEAARKRKQRERDMSRDKSEKCHGTSHGDRREKKEEEELKKEEPPCSPPRGDQIPYSSIITTFNEIVRPAKPYRASPVNKSIARLISARWKEGMRPDDFAEVTRIMLAKWGGDEKMVDYIRPHTLWTGKMESYLAAGAASRKGESWKQELLDEMGGPTDE